MASIAEIGSDFNVSLPTWALKRPAPSSFESGAGTAMSSRSTPWVHRVDLDLTQYQAALTHDWAGAAA